MSRGDTKDRTSSAAVDHAVRDALLHVSDGAGDPGTVYVAFSGGLDSSVLLDAACRVAPAVEAVHVHHGLHPDADGWSDRCRATAASLGCAFRRLDVDVDPAEGGLEAAARRARYRAFQDALPPESVLLLAHHAGDQTETVLLQLFRGAGPEGLAGMPGDTRRGQLRLIRPLLGLERTVLAAAARERGLDWLEDPANDDRRHPRNVLRLDVLPALRRHWPALDRTVARSAGLMADAAALMEDLAALDLERCAEGDTLRVGTLGELPRRRQANVLRHWLRRQGLPAPDSRRLASLLDQLDAADDRQPRVEWAGAEVRRFRDRLHAMLPLPPPPEPTPWPEPDRAQVLPGSGRLRLADADHGLDPASLRSGPVRVAFRSGGEHLHLAGSRHGRSLKQLFNEAAVPPWMRGRTPMLYVGDQLVAVAGLGVVEGWQAPEGTEALELVWEADPWIGDGGDGG